MTEAMPFLQKAILLSYAPRSLRRSVFVVTGENVLLRESVEIN